MGMFKSTMGEGFHFTFDNGYTVSTQIGYKNYCQNYNNFEVSEMLRNGARRIEIKSKDCEIAICDKQGDWVTEDIFDKFDKNINCKRQFAGYIDFNKWFELMKFVETL